MSDPVVLCERYQYRTADIIGSGSFGDCYRGVDLHTGKQVAIKVTQQTEQTDKDRLTAEAKSLEGLVHPNIVRGIDHFFVEDQFYIIMDYYENGDLQAYIETHPSTQAQITKWMAQLASALNYIHTKHIVHRDIKLSNLLLSKELDLFLGDFGSVKQLLGAEFCQTFIGTPTIMSPEVIAG